MPRFNFDLVGARAVHDRHGLIFADCRRAARFADELAAELAVIRPELRNNACVVMTDQGRDTLTYCVAISESRPLHDGSSHGN
jgi:hypothetical protein